MNWCSVHDFSMARVAGRTGAVRDCTAGRMPSNGCKHWGSRHLDEQDVVDLVFAPLLGPALVRGIRGAVVQSRQPSAATPLHCRCDAATIVLDGTRKTSAATSLRCRCDAATHALDETRKRSHCMTLQQRQSTSIRYDLSTYIWAARNIMQGI